MINMKKTYIQPQSEYTNMCPGTALLNISGFTEDYSDPGSQL